MTTSALDVSSTTRVLFGCTEDEEKGEEEEEEEEDEGKEEVEYSVVISHRYKV